MSKKKAPPKRKKPAKRPRQKPAVETGFDLGLEAAPAEEKRGRGRPEFKPSAADRQMVTALAAFGIPEKEISRLVAGGISNNTLRKHFDDELETGTARAVAKVAQTLFTKATAKDLSQPSVTAAIFFLKARGKWKDTSALELSDPSGVLLASFKAAVLGVDPSKKPDDAGDGRSRTH